MQEETGNAPLPRTPITRRQHLLALWRPVFGELKPLENPAQIIEVFFNWLIHGIELFLLLAAHFLWYRRDRRRMRRGELTAEDLGRRHGFKRIAWTSVLFTVLITFLTLVYSFPRPGFSLIPDRLLLWCCDALQKEEALILHLTRSDFHQHQILQLMNYEQGNFQRTVVERLLREFQVAANQRRKDTIFDMLKQILRNSVTENRPDLQMFVIEGFAGLAKVQAHHRNHLEKTAATYWLLLKDPSVTPQVKTQLLQALEPLAFEVWRGEMESYTARAWDDPVVLAKPLYKPLYKLAMTLFGSNQSLDLSLSLLGCLIQVADHQQAVDILNLFGQAIDHPRLCLKLVPIADRLWKSQHVSGEVRQQLLKQMAASPIAASTPLLSTWLPGVASEHAPALFDEIRPLLLKTSADDRQVGYAKLLALIRFFPELKPAAWLFLVELSQRYDDEAFRNFCVSLLAVIKPNTVSGQINQGSDFLKSQWLGEVSKDHIEGDHETGQLLLFGLDEEPEPALAKAADYLSVSRPDFSQRTLRRDIYRKVLHIYFNGQFSSQALAVLNVFPDGQLIDLLEEDLRGKNPVTRARIMDGMGPEGFHPAVLDRLLGRLFRNPMGDDLAEFLSGYTPLLVKHSRHRNRLRLWAFANRMVKRYGATNYSAASLRYLQTMEAMFFNHRPGHHSSYADRNYWEFNTTDLMKDSLQIVWALIERTDLLGVEARRMLASWQNPQTLDPKNRAQLGRMVMDHRFTDLLARMPFMRKAVPGDFYWLGKVLEFSRGESLVAHLVARNAFYFDDYQRLEKEGANLKFLHRVLPYLMANPNIGNGEFDRRGILQRALEKYGRNISLQSGTNLYFINDSSLLFVTLPQARREWLLDKVRAEARLTVQNAQNQKVRFPLLSALVENDASQLPNVPGIRILFHLARHIDAPSAETKMALYDELMTFDPNSLEASGKPDERAVYHGAVLALVRLMLMHDDLDHEPLQQAWVGLMRHSSNPKDDVAFQLLMLPFELDFGKGLSQDDRGRWHDTVAVLFDLTETHRSFQFFKTIVWDLPSVLSNKWILKAHHRGNNQLQALGGYRKLLGIALNTKNAWLLNTLLSADDFVPHELFERGRADYLRSEYAFLQLHRKKTGLGRVMPPAASLHMEDYVDRLSGMEADLPLEDLSQGDLFLTRRQTDRLLGFAMKHVTQPVWRDFLRKVSIQDFFRAGVYTRKLTDSEDILFYALHDAGLEQILRPKLEKFAAQDPQHRPLILEGLAKFTRRKKAMDTVLNTSTPPREKHRQVAKLMKQKSWNSYLFRDMVIEPLLPVLKEASSGGPCHSFFQDFAFDGDQDSWPCIMDGLTQSDRPEEIAWYLLDQSSLPTPSPEMKERLFEFLREKSQSETMKPWVIKAIKSLRYKWPGRESRDLFRTWLEDLQKQP